MKRQNLEEIETIDFDSGNLSEFNFEEIREKLKERFPFGLIPRTKLAELTGGILNPRTLANEDCRGIGIADPITIKGKICYKIDNILDYLNQQTQKKLKETI